MPPRRYATLLVALLLTSIGFFYYWTDGDPAGYFRSVFREEPERINEVSPEEFRRLLRARKRRHTPDDRTERQYPDPEPDTDVREAWDQNFPDRVIRGLSELRVIPTRPDTPVDGIRGPGPGGTSRSLNEYRGRWVLLNFWASWCLPCREEMPALNRLHNEYSGKLVVLGLNVGENEKTVSRFVEEQDLDFPVLRDEDGSIPARYGVRALPVTWLVGPDGKVLGSARGPREWADNEALETFDTLTNEGALQNSSSEDTEVQP